MNLLLDTGVVLYWLDGATRLSAGTVRAIETAETVFVSVLSPWEMSIKMAMGKLSLEGDPLEAILHSGFKFLPVKPEHGWAAGRLPPLHRDPFDRIFIAQAQAEGLVIVTSDRDIPRYAVPSMPA